MYRFFFKHFIDLFCSIIGFTLLLPVFLLTCLLLFCANQGKLFFLQPRPGKDGKIFKVIKFKTMNDKKDRNNNLLSDDERITTIGAFIRKTSLDEIPQLLNVIKGDMSLVGPRPLLVEYMPLYNEEQSKRHLVRPGITGWAQVNGRNAISWEQRFVYDTWYVEHMSFVLDMKILVKTIGKVVKSEGVSSQTTVSMTKFTGNNI